MDVLVWNQLCQTENRMQTLESLIFFSRRRLWSLEIYRLAKFLTPIQTEGYVHISEIYIDWETIQQWIDPVTCMDWTKTFLFFIFSKLKLLLGNAEKEITAHCYQNQNKRPSLINFGSKYSLYRTWISTWVLLFYYCISNSLPREKTSLTKYKFFSLKK